MPTPVILLLIAAVLPLLAFTALLFLGKRLGNPLAGYVGTGFIAGSFVCCIAAMISWYGGGSYNNHAWGVERGPVVSNLRWLPIGSAGNPMGSEQDAPGWLDIGLFVDSLTITMFGMICMVALLVHIFSIGYMRQDGRFARFFAYLGLFCFSMLMLVLGGTLLQLLIFWELVGICSYLLIGFWWEKRTASNAAIKAFVVNRIGDAGMLFGLGILLWHVGNSSYPHLWVLLGRAGTGKAIALPDGTVFTTAWLTAMGIGLFCGAMGKSAQFPLHVWLADAMEGPTPVSALIHAATMVAAGVYLLARIFPLLTPDARLFIALIGLITLTMGALIAVVQTDIKKVLAFSTLSQLGFMVLGMGVGSWIGAIFHLITHGFFKALLFLGAGSVIRAAHHEQELGEFGGLMWRIPVTAATFLVGVLAIAGLGAGRWGFSGYFSKDMILTHAGAFASLAVHYGHWRGLWVFFTLPVIIALLTPFYMMRCWMLTFWGKPRVPQLYDRASELPSMFWPLLCLSALALISGRFMNVQEMLTGSLRENTSYCRQFDPSFNGFASAWPVDIPTDRTDPVGSATAAAMETSKLLVEKYLGFWPVLGSLFLAFALYLRGLQPAARMASLPIVSSIHRWLYNRMYFDELYFSLIVAGARFISRCTDWIDRNVIDQFVMAWAKLARGIARRVDQVDRVLVDGAVVGVGSMAVHMGDAVRAQQTGRLRQYVAAAVIAMTLLLAAAVVVLFSH